MKARHKRIWLCVLTGILCTCNTSKEVYDFDNACSSIGFHNNPENIKIVKQMQKRKSHIIFIEDTTSGNRFVVKQTDRESEKRQFDIINEALGSHIAQSIKIPTQRVIIIPANAMNSIKKYPQIPASLHTFVPGKIVRESSYKQIDIKQYGNSDKTKPKSGLIYERIRDMSLHPELPRIVAFDTFIGMNDRSGVNYLYDKQTDTFWLIDMADAFKINLCKIACAQVRKMIDNEELALTTRECCALRVYRNTMQFLIRQYPPEKLQNLFDSYLEQAAFYFTDKVIELRKQIMSESYADARKLIPLLNKLIAKRKDDVNVHLPPSSGGEKIMDLGVGSIVLLVHNQPFKLVR